MNGVQTRFKCKLDVKRCKRFVFPPSSLLPRSNALKTKAIRYFQTDQTLTRIVSSPLYAFYKADTEFDATNATVEGTWENKVFTEDLKNAAAYLKLLRDADIPVLWRPFHEAAGGWFWWGKDAASFKSLWIAMFNYFKTEGLDNLIWVWTTEGNDADWYPGDQYVDIVGRDVYNKETADCVSEYTSIAENYGNKIVSLSECGTVGLISEQWASGARWSWFMPWYDGTNEDGSPVVHADEAWWKDAMSQEFVVSREELPSME